MIILSKNTFRSDNSVNEGLRGTKFPKKNTNKNI